MKSLYLKDGIVVDPANSKLDKKNLFIKNGRIDDVGSNEENVNNDTEIISLKGKYIVPGLIDLRCHLKQPGINFKESIDAVSKKALSGGFTSVLAMPSLSSMADNPETLNYVRETVLQKKHVKIYLSGCLTLNSRGEHLAPLGSLKEAGIVAVTDSPNSPQNNQIYCKAVEYASMFDLPIFDLPRDLSLSPDASAHESLMSLKMGLKGYPRMAEELFVQRAIMVSKYTKARIHLTSISSGGSVELIRKAKEDNIDITCDVTSNHLFNTESGVEEFDSFSKALPPFREEEDRQKLIEGILDNTIDAISSGHQPFNIDDKNQEYDKAPMGTLGLENAFLQSIAIVNENHGLGLIKVVQKMSYNPSRILGINNNTLNKNDVADFFIYDPNDNTTITRAIQGNEGCNLPFKEKVFNGKILNTYIKGDCLYKYRNEF